MMLICTDCSQRLCISTDSIIIIIIIITWFKHVMSFTVSEESQVWKSHVSLQEGTTI